MPHDLENERKHRLGRALAGTLAAGALAAALGLSTAVAHDHGTMCGPVIDGTGDAVRQSDGDILLHGGSFPCPPADEVTEPAEPVSGVVYFDFDVDVPNAEGEAALADILGALKDQAPDRVNVAGHADRAGTEVYNEDLSQRRADTIAKRLIAGGVDASTITIEAFGETRPAVPTDDGVREPANRRVEIDQAF